MFYSVRNSKIKRLRDDLENLDTARDLQYLLDDAMNNFRAWGDNGTLIQIVSMGLAARVIKAFEERNVEGQATIIFAVKKLTAKYNYYDYKRGAYCYAIDAVIHQLMCQTKSALRHKKTNATKYIALFKVLVAFLDLVQFPNVKTVADCFNLLDQLELKMGKQVSQNAVEHLVVVQKVNLLQDRELMAKANITKQEALELKEQAKRELIAEEKKRIVRKRGRKEKERRAHYHCSRCRSHDHRRGSSKHRRSSKKSGSHRSTRYRSQSRD